LAVIICDHHYETMADRLKTVLGHIQSPKLPGNVCVSFVATNSSINIALHRFFFFYRFKNYSIIVCVTWSIYQTWYLFLYIHFPSSFALEIKYYAQSQGKWSMFYIPSWQFIWMNEYVLDSLYEEIILLSFVYCHLCF
jgi:hypothetical protein